MRQAFYLRLAHHHLFVCINPPIHQSSESMSDIKPIVLVTGVSGFVGSHVAYHLLQAGYTVRGTVRQTRVESVRKTAGAVYPNLQIVEVNDIGRDDLSEALKDVGAIIHVASPLAGTEDNTTVLNTAINGTINVLKQAVRSNINKVVLTSSFSALLDPDLKDVYSGVTWSEKDWGNVIWEEAVESKNPLFTYFASKIFAERAAWKFARENPSLDLATILPPFIYGPFAPGFPLRGSGISTNSFIQALIVGEPGRPVPPHVRTPFFVDVRDVARAHVEALRAPKVAAGGDLESKRFLLSGGEFTWTEAVLYLQETRPELQKRLPAVGVVEPPEGVLGTIDTRLAKEVLGLEFIGWKKCVDDTVDALLESEKQSSL